MKDSSHWTLRQSTLTDAVCTNTSRDALSGHPLLLSMLDVPCGIIFFLFPPYTSAGVGWGRTARLSLLYDLFPVQQTMNGIGHRVKCFFGLATNTLKNNDNNRTIFFVAAQSHVLILATMFTQLPHTTLPAIWRARGLCVAWVNCI